MRAFLIAAALGLCAAASAAPLPALAAEPAAADKATALAERVLDPWLNGPVQRQLLKAGFEAGLDSDPDTKAVLAEHPGLKEDLFAAIDAAVGSGDPAGNADFIAVVAGVYRTRLNAGEIDALLTFYGTPTGKKMLGAAYGAVDASAIAAEMAAVGKVETATLDKAMADAKRDVAATLTAQDEGALKALAGALDQAKMDAVNAEVRRVTDEWSNKPTPELDARIDAAVAKVFERYGL